MKLLEIKNLTISIKKDRHVQQKIVKQGFVLNSGDVLLLSGPNGCGKSSIIKSIIGDTIGFNGLVATGDFYYYEKDKRFKINKNDETLSYFAGKVCYISQNDETAFSLVIDSFLSGIDKEKIINKEKYVFDFILKYNAYNAFFNDFEDYKLTSAAKKLIHRVGADVENDACIKTALFLTSRKKHMSGGQSKFLNILSNLIRIEFCSLCFIDEPLNNLDYSNVRLFSNILHSLHSEYPDVAFVIVTHCRSIPIITRIIQIDSKNKTLVEMEDVASLLPNNCNGCFGVIENGRYI